MAVTLQQARGSAAAVMMVVGSQAGSVRLREVGFGDAHDTWQLWVGDRLPAVAAHEDDTAGVKGTAAWTSLCKGHRAQRR